MSVGLKSAVAFVLGMVVILAVGTAAFVYTHRLQGDNRRVRHTQEVLEKLDHILLTLDDAETGQRGYLLTGEERYLEPYNTAAPAIRNDIDAAIELMRDDTAQQHDLEAVRARAGDKLAELRETIGLRRTAGLGPAVAVVRTDRGKKRMDEIRALIAAMETRERQLLADRTAAADAAAAADALDGCPLDAGGDAGAGHCGHVDGPHRAVGRASARHSRRREARPRPPPSAISGPRSWSSPPSGCTSGRRDTARCPPLSSSTRPSCWRRRSAAADRASWPPCWRQCWPIIIFFRRQAASGSIGPAMCSRWASLPPTASA